MCKKLSLLLAVLILLLSSVSVYATGDSASIQQEWGLKDEQMGVWMSVWQAMKASGLSDVACAAVMGNLKAESGLRGSASESGGTGAGIGIAQWSTNSNRQGLADWACEHTKTNVKGYNICTNEVCQAGYLVSDLEKSWIDSYHAKYNEYAAKYADTGVPQNVTLYTQFANFKTATDIKGAAIAMFDCYERGAGINILIGSSPTAYPKGYSGEKNNLWFFKNEHINRVSYAEKAYVLFTNSTVPASQEAGEQIATQLVSAGYWTEDELSIYSKLIESPVDLSNAVRENLTQDQLQGLSMWERENKHNIEEGGAINLLRRVVMLAGILFTIWMALIYCAYWFDRINNIFYIDTLGILTFGHLHMSDNEQESTFRVKDIGKENHKTVRHRDILFICLAGTAFGVAIITGGIYTALRWLNDLIVRILGRL